MSGLCRLRALFVVACLWPGLVSGKSVYDMTEAEFRALTEAQVASSPLLDAMAVALAEKDQARRPQARRMAAFLLASLLQDLKYPVVPTGDESPALAAAVRGFQRGIGAPQTGVLLMGEFQKLTDAAEKMRPARISLPSASVSGGTGYARAQGTWVFENDSQGYPLQTSQIRCDRQEARCEETNAQVSGGNILFLTNDYYAVSKWTEDEVVAENDAAACVSYTLTLNLRKQEAHLFRRGKGGKGCEGIATKPQILRLVGGYKIALEYYEKREAEGRHLANPDYAKAFESVMGAWKDRKE